MSKSDVTLRVRGLSKVYKLYGSSTGRVVEWLSLGRAVRHRKLVALQPLDLQVGRGECVGLVGRNGSGKSTLVKLLAKILEPSTGSVEHYGMVLAIAELRAGFDRELTAERNIRSAAAMLRMDLRDVKRSTAEIIEFAELAGREHRPLREYSSGMIARLAFSLYMHLRHDVLLIDEVLAVGDAGFREKCHDLIRKRVHEEGQSIVYVSHAMESIASMCTRVVWLNDGELMGDGETAEVLDRFREHTEAHAEEAEASAQSRSLATLPPGAPLPVRVWAETTAGERTERVHGAAPWTVVAELAQNSGGAVRIDLKRSRVVVDSVIVEVPPGASEARAEVRGGLTAGPVLCVASAVDPANPTARRADAVRASVECSGPERGDGFVELMSPQSSVREVADA